MLVPKITIGNDKLSKDKVATFSLPAGDTCPGADKCKPWCYARAGHYCFRDAVDLRKRNFLASLESNFVVSIVTQIEILPQTWRYVRIHDSGDFYSQEYLEKWIKIISECQGKQFYCYTKSLHLDWSEALKLKNFVRIQSSGGLYDELINETQPHAVVFPSLDALEKAGYVDCSKSDIPAANGAVMVGLIVHGGKRRHY